MQHDTISKTQKIGGSIFVRIPKDVANEENIKENQTLSIEIGKLRKSWFGAFKGIGPFTREDEMKGHD